MLTRLNISCLVLLLFPAIGALSQNYSYSGLITDRYTQEPLSLVNISLPAKNFRTVSNKSGQFNVNASLHDTLYFNCIGYQRNLYVVTKDSAIQVSMIPLAYELAEVNVSGVNPQQIFQKALRKITHSAERYDNADAFFRLVTLTNDTCTELIEKFCAVIVGNTGIKNWNLAHGRYAIAKAHKEKELPVSTDFTLITRHMDIVNKNSDAPIHYLPVILDKRYIKYIDLHLDKSIFRDSVEIYKIDFKTKPEFLDKISTHGSLYIGRKNHCVYRIEQWWDKWTIPIVRPSDKQFGIKNLAVKFDINYIPVHSQEKLTLNYIRTNIDYELFNKINDERTKMVSTYSDFVLYQYKNKIHTTRVDTFFQADPGNDYLDIRKRFYVKKFWERNPVLSETPYERQVRQLFESQDAFGKAIDEDNENAELEQDGYFITDADHKFDTRKIIHTKQTPYHKSMLELKKDGVFIAGMRGFLLTSWNCYNDSLYHKILSLADLNYTWLDPGEITSLGVNYVYENYFRLLEIHKHLLMQKLNRIVNPCDHIPRVLKVIEHEEKLFLSESRSMVIDCWGNGMRGAYKWDRIIANYKHRSKE